MKKKKQKSKRKGVDTDPVFVCQEHGRLKIDQLIKPAGAGGGIPMSGCLCKTCERPVSVKVPGETPRCESCEVGLNIHTGLWNYNKRTRKWIHNCKMFRKNQNVAPKKKAKIKRVK